MAKYTMPDGNLYDFSSDDEATKAMTAWQKQFGNEEPSYLSRVGQAGEALGRSAIGIAGAIPQAGAALVEGTFTSTPWGKVWGEASGQNLASMLPKSKGEVPEFEQTVGHGMEKLGEGLGQVARFIPEATGLAGVPNWDQKKVLDSIKDPKARSEAEKVFAAQESAGEAAGNFVPLPLLGKGKGKPKETPKAHEDILKAIDEDLNKKPINYADAYKEWNSIDSQLGKAKNPYRASNRNKDWLDENNMPVMETIGEAPKFDPTVPKLDPNLILRGAEREQPLPTIQDPEYLQNEQVFLLQWSILLLALESLQNA